MPTCRLVVEVLSPSTAQVDRARKRALYARVRFPDYWIVASTHASSSAGDRTSSTLR